MTKEEQWKILRAPLVQEAWSSGRAMSYKRRRIILDFIKAEGFIKRDKSDNEYARFHYAQCSLHDAREAERNGEDPVLWKLSQP